MPGTSVVSLDELCCRKTRDRCSTAVTYQAWAQKPAAAALFLPEPPANRHCLWLNFRKYMDIHALCTLSNGNLAAPGGRDEWKTMHAAYDQLITPAATNTLGCMQNNPHCWSVGNNIVVRRGQLCCCMCYAVQASERCSLQHNVVPQDDHAADGPVAAATSCSFCPVRSSGCVRNSVLRLANRRAFRLTKPSNHR